MSSSTEYYTKKCLCEHCKHFERYELNYHIVDDDGKIVAKQIESPFGRCCIRDKSLEGRESSCSKFQSWKET